MICPKCESGRVIVYEREQGYECLACKTHGNFRHYPAPRIAVGLERDRRVRMELLSSVGGIAEKVIPYLVCLVIGMWYGKWLSK